ncbi:MAG: ATP-binding protein [Syntrophorhabdaceae bacterium]|nr:ATP-binding protein [Syntrophorhabdaceae bacterium]
MSSSLLDRAKRNFSLRLTLWYAVVSVIAYVVIFTLAYYNLLSSLKKEDEKAISSIFNKYRQYYNEDGLSGLQSQIALERNSEKPVLFLVRVADQDNHSLFLSLPDKWQGVDLVQIGPININMKIQKIRPKISNIETLFEIHTFALEDGNFMQIGNEIIQREELLTRFRHIFFAVMIPAILIALIGGYLVTFKALLPIRHLTGTIKSIVKTGEVGARVPEGKTDNQFSELIVLFNDMIGRIEHLIEGMKESLDNVAHEVRTPITRLRVLAENALASDQDIGSYREALSDCMEESERLIKMLNTLMDISEAKAGTLKLDREEGDISSLVEEVVEVYGYIAEEKNIKINTEYSEGVMALVDPNRIRQALGNLIDNSVKYTPPGGMVNIRVYKKEPKEAVIEIRDNGIGIDEKDLPKIWERLYRGDQSRSQKGLGLGLSLVKSIVELHGGHIEVKSRPNFGSTFFVYLPIKE